MTPEPPPLGGPGEPGQPGPGAAGRPGAAGGPPGGAGPDPATSGRPDDAGATPGGAGPERPLHGSLQPRGEDVAWSALGSLLAGPLVWGGVGLLADRWLGTSPALTVTGVVVGAITAFYIVYVRFGRGG